MSELPEIQKTKLLCMVELVKSPGLIYEDLNLKILSK